MVTQQYNLSLDPALIERYNRLVPKGDRTSEISKLISDYCDRKESEQVAHRAKKIWFEKTIKPFIRGFAGQGDLFSLIEDEKLKKAFRESRIKVSESDIKLCIEQLIVEGEE